METKSYKILGVTPEEIWEHGGKEIVEAHSKGFGEEMAVAVVRNSRLTERELAFLILRGISSIYGDSK